MHLFINNLRSNSVRIGLKCGRNSFWLSLPHCCHRNEEILVGINGLLEKNRKEIESLRGIVVVSGPGSFASIRVALAVCNTLGFIFKIPVAGVVMDEESDNALFEKGLKKLTKKRKFKSAAPFYGEEPNISQAKKVL